MPEGVNPTGPTEAATLTDVAKPAPAEPIGDLAGKHYAHYRVEKRLGKGGMGEVYLATDLALERPVALKFLAADVAESPALRQRFLREARAQARLTHPNICHIYFVGEEGDQLFFAMELIEGESLQERLDREGKIPEGDAVELCRQAALGLREAHRHGFTHRDVKPSNLMIDRHGMVKLVDFGIVKQQTEQGKESLALTNEGGGSLIGTPLYMAPEQARGDKVDFRADVYSLGATLHHLVAGKPPFEADTSLGVVAKHLTDPRPQLVKRRLRGGPSPADALCDRMMAKSPDDRFPSYDDLIAAMERMSPVSSRPAGFWVRSLATGLDLLILLAILTVPLLLVQLAIAQITDRPSLELQLGKDWIFPVAAAVYAILGHGRWGKTFGKALLDLEVVPYDRAGTPGIATAARRFAWQWGLFYLLAGASTVCEAAYPPAAKVLGILALLVLLAEVMHLLVSATHPSKRTLWDLRSGTVVRYRK